MTSTDTLIRDLSANLAPVKRRSLWREAGALLALGAAEVALIVTGGVMRHDMGQAILSAPMLWKIGSLAILAGVSCTVAIKSFAPPTPSRRGLGLLFALSALAILAGALATPAADVGRSLAERLSPVQGLRCTAAIMVLATPVVALLGVLMRRAAPTHPRRSALATGLAAAMSGALVFTVCCPMNDPLYVVVWYSAGIAAVAAIARWLLPRRFRL